MTSSQIVKIASIATMWYSIYWMRTLTKKHNIFAISIAAASTVNYILRFMKGPSPNRISP